MLDGRESIKLEEEEVLEDDDDDDDVVMVPMMCQKSKEKEVQEIL
jgi:hypothetical protein